MFLNNFSPNPILFEAGPISIYWYGFLITLGLILGFFVFYKLDRRAGLKKNDIFDLSFWLIVWGIIGGRLYHVLSESGYYVQHPLEIFFIWNGGVGIYGAIIAGLLVIHFYTRKNNIQIKNFKFHPPNRRTNFKKI